MNKIYIFLICFCIYGCNLVYSPSSKLPSKKLKPDESEINIGFQTLPNVTSNNRSKGAEILTRYAYSDDIFLSGKTWFSLDDINEDYIGGIGFALSYIMYEGNDNNYFGISPKLESLNNNKKYGADLVGVNFSYWTVENQWNYFIDIGSKYGFEFINILNGDNGYILDFNIGSSYRINNFLFLGTELNYSFRNHLSGGYTNSFYNLSLYLDYYGFISVFKQMRITSQHNNILSITYYQNYNKEQPNIISLNFDYIKEIINRVSLNAKLIILYPINTNENHFGSGIGAGVNWDFFKYKNITFNYEYGGGGIYFSESFPKKGTRFNYYRLWGLAVKYNISNLFNISFQYNDLHISNGKGMNHSNNPSLDARGYKIGIEF